MSSEGQVAKGIGEVGRGGDAQGYSGKDFGSTCTGLKLRKKLRELVVSVEHILSCPISTFREHVWVVMELTQWLEH
jgi:hypothetical protein